MKRQTEEWEKMLTNHISDKGCINKGLSKIKTKTSYPIKNCRKYLNRFFKEDVQMTSKHAKVVQQDQD